MSRRDSVYLHASSGGEPSHNFYAAIDLRSGNLRGATIIRHVYYPSRRALDPVRLQKSGDLPRGEIARIVLIVRDHETGLLRSRNDYFAD